jgi:hypothetical protein
MFMVVGGVGLVLVGWLVGWLVGLGSDPRLKWLLDDWDDWELRGDLSTTISTCFK